MCSPETAALLRKHGFHEAVAVDFEFVAAPGERPDPVSLAAHELISGRKHRLWKNQFGRNPPYATDPSTLFIAFYASAELACHLQLDWPMPARVLDPFVEYRLLTNGLGTVAGSGLLGACAAFGISTMAGGEKDSHRELVLRGGPWSEAERREIINYNEADASALSSLVDAMLPRIDLPRALLRGRYMKAASAMEHSGVPTDVTTLTRLQVHWADIKDALITEIDSDYGVFDRSSFRRERFERYLIRNDIAWPRLESGALDLSRRTFREMTKVHPAIAPLHELRSSLSELRLNKLSVGRDGRNRTLLSAFRARTGRNQPSNARFLFGPATWIRGLIKPDPGYAIAYVDWSQQEFGIAAALSGDERMLAAYRSGDPYLSFAIQAGAAPPDATKDTHATVREMHKIAVLAVQYGMEWPSLAGRLGQPPIVARELLESHRQTYRTFWRWSDRAVDLALLGGRLNTAFGWTIHADQNANPRSLRNFPAQANGAEMMRIAACLATERGLEVCAPVHDAFLISAPIDRIKEDAHRMQACMAEASRAVLAGFELRSDVKIVRYPDRYMDRRGKVMWRRVLHLVEQFEAQPQRKSA